MPQPPETYHTSPALYSDLDIPEGISGTLPTAGRTRVGLSAEVEEDLGGTRRRGGRDGGGRDSGRSGGRGGRSGGGERPARGPRREEAAPEAATPADEAGDRPRRQRRRRKPGESLAQSDEGTATAPSALFSDGSQSVAPDLSGAGESESDAPSDEGDATGRPRRRRRRGGRGTRGATGADSTSEDGESAPADAGSASGEMTGGSDAGVGTGAQN